MCLVNILRIWEIVEKYLIIYETLYCSLYTYLARLQTDYMTEDGTHVR